MRRRLEGPSCHWPYGSKRMLRLPSCRLMSEKTGEKQCCNSTRKLHLQEQVIPKASGPSCWLGNCCCRFEWMIGHGDTPILKQFKILCHRSLTCSARGKLPVLPSTKDGKKPQYVDANEYASSEHHISWRNRPRQRLQLTNKLVCATLLHEKWYAILQLCDPILGVPHTDSDLRRLISSTCRTSVEFHALMSFHTQERKKLRSEMLGHNHGSFGVTTMIPLIIPEVVWIRVFSGCGNVKPGTRPEILEAKSRDSLLFLSD